MTLVKDKSSVVISSKETAQGFLYECSTTTACARGYTCDPERKICVKTDGMTCVRATDCYSKACSSVCYTINGTSFSRGDVNTRCPCKKDFSRCNKDGVCKLLANQGCTFNEDCYSGVCDKSTSTCAAVQNVGQICLINEGCTTSNCSIGYCQEKNVVSGKYGSVCLPGPCDGELTCNTSTKKCVPAFPIGTVCSNTTKCIQGSTCLSSPEGVSTCQFSGDFGTCFGVCPAGMTCNNNLCVRDVAHSQVCTTFQTNRFSLDGGIKSLNVYSYSPGGVKRFVNSQAGEAILFNSGLLQVFNIRTVSGVDLVSQYYYTVYDEKNVTTTIKDIVTNNTIYTVQGKITDIDSTSVKSSIYMYFILNGVLYGGKTSDKNILSQTVPLSSTPIEIRCFPRRGDIALVYKDTNSEIRFHDDNTDRLISRNLLVNYFSCYESVMYSASDTLQTIYVTDFNSLHTVTVQYHRHPFYGPITAEFGDVRILSYNAC